MTEFYDGGSCPPERVLLKFYLLLSNLAVCSIHEDNLAIAPASWQCSSPRGDGICQSVWGCCLIHEWGTPRPESRIGQRYNPHTFSFIHNQPKAPLEDEGQEEMFMKHLFTMLLALVAATASAYDFEADGIYYNILSQDDRTVEVTESPYGYAGDVVIPAEVMYDGRTYQVTTIGERAFYECVDLVSVDMQGVTTIGVGAFSSCGALTSVEMPAVTTISDEAFAFCSLTSVSMLSVATIGNEAFGSCFSLASVSMPEVTTIGDRAFYRCESLTSVSMPEVTTISDQSFRWCSALTSVEMPAVTTIGREAFSCCEALTSVSMPVATTIDGWAFYDCKALTSVSMPEVTAIGNYAFYCCNALTSVDIPASVTMIGDYAFDECSSLTSVYCYWEQPLECEPEFTSEVLMNATLYVPTGTIDAYRSVDPWRWFINIEEGNYSGIADATASEVTIKVIDGVITVEGGVGTASAPVVEVYSAGGQCVWRGTDSSIGGLTHGVYVVKVGDTVQKVAL